MSADELLIEIYKAGVRLWADGDVLRFDAPKGVLTPELKDRLKSMKGQLLDKLRPSTAVVSFRGGLVVPKPAFDLAIDLERRGFLQSTDSDHQYRIEVTADSGPLTIADEAGIARWRHHLGALIQYQIAEVPQ